MNLKTKYIHLIFWTIAIIIWILWIQESIRQFEYFIGNYKNIGYIIDTNGYQFVWYLLISASKFTLLLVIFYRIIPVFGFQKAAIYNTLLWIGILLFIEWGAAKLLYHFLSNKNFENYRLDWNYNLLNNILIFFIWAILSWVIAASYKWFNNYNELKKLHQNQKSYIQLKEQLNPHFIFNSLNSLYELSLQEKNERLQEGILDLTDTIRYTIDYSNKPEVSLRKEISAIRSYIALQKRRIELNEITVRIDSNLEKSNAVITPLLLLSYIENAFKHGYNSEVYSEINIELKENVNGIYLMLKNTNHAVFDNAEGGNQKNKRLLELNYPNKHQLKITNNKDFYNLELWMKLS